jgi:hypothetical protein
MAKRNNTLVVPQSHSALNQLKAEVAAELGFANYDQMDKGEIPARVHGAIGGAITKRLIELGEQALSNGAALNQSNLNIQEYRNDMIQDLK